jgi:hypothetical protein
MEEVRELAYWPWDDLKLKRMTFTPSPSNIGLPAVQVNTVYRHGPAESDRLICLLSTAGETYLKALAGPDGDRRVPRRYL